MHISIFKGRKISKNTCSEGGWGGGGMEIPEKQQGDSEAGEFAVRPDSKKAKCTSGWDIE